MSPPASSPPSSWACHRSSPWDCWWPPWRPRRASPRAMFVPLFALVMFLGGVYLPRAMLPEFLIRIGDYTPPGVQALLDAWSGTSPQPAQLAVMALITVLAGAVAATAVPLGMSASPAPALVASSSDRRYERWNDAADRLVPVRHARPCRRSWPSPRPGATDGERLVTAGLVGLAALWVFLGYTRAPRPRKAHQLRMIVYFVGLLAIASALAVREYIFFLFLITGFFHASVLRPWPVVFAGVFATSVLVNTVIGGFPTNPEWWTIYVAIIVDPDARDRGWRAARRADGRAERAAAPDRGAARGGARGERRPARPAADPGARGRRARRAAAHGPRDPRHHRPGADRDRHPARGGRAGQRPAGRSGSVTSGTRSAWPGTACRRRGDRSRACGRSTSRPPGCPMRSPRSPEQWSELNGVPVEVVTTGDVQPLHRRGRGGAVADGTGGAGQRREARQCVARLADAVLHGRRRDARRPGRRRRVHGARRSRQARRRLRAVGDAPAGQSRRRDAGHRIRAGRRERRSRHACRRSWRPAWSAGHDATDPPAHRRRPPGRA